MDEFKKTMDKFPRTFEAPTAPSVVPKVSGGFSGGGWMPSGSYTAYDPGASATPQARMEQFLKLVEKRAANPNIDTDKLRAEIGEYLSEVTNRLSAALRDRED